MEQKEKSRISREKILTAAIKEFGTHGYDTSSLNSICAEHKIAKGLIYHHFKNKEELYLICVRECFDRLVEYIEEFSGQESDIEKNMQEYFGARVSFFREYPYFGRIFLETTLYPPKDLRVEIKAIKKSFDEFNTQRFRGILELASLRKEVTFDEALSYFCIYQEMVNGYFQNLLTYEADNETCLEMHEKKLPKLMDMMLYGIVKEEQE